MYEAPNEAQWRQWVEEHLPKLLLFARQKARSEADAQDLVQECLVEVCTRQASGQLPPLPLVFATIHRRAIDLGRREDRRVGRELAATEPAAQWWLDTTVEQRETQRILQDAMKQLPGDYREVITLKIWGELTFAEIADVLGIPANTAASRYRYGLEALRRRTKVVLV